MYKTPGHQCAENTEDRGALEHVTQRLLMWTLYTRSLPVNMEKYTQFRDKATGISPFMPLVRTENSFLLPLKVLLFTARCLVSLPLLVGSLVPFHPLSKLFVRLVLLVCGLLSYEVSVQGVKRVKDTTGFYPVKNEVYFVNFTSLLEYFMLWVLSKDSFVVLIPNEQGKLKKYGGLSFVSRALGGEDTGASFSFNELTNSVIYIFAEGTTTNGKAIVPFTITEPQWKLFYQQLSQDKKTHKIKTLSMKLYPSHLTTPLALPFAQYFYRVLSEWKFTYKIRINFSEDETLLKVKNAFAYNGKSKLVEGVGLKEKKEFVKVFRGRK